MKKFLPVVIILALAAGAYLYFANPDPPQIPCVQPKRERLVSYLTTNGRVEPSEAFEIFSGTTGRVVAVPVREGDRVKKGSVVAGIDDEDARARLEQAKARLQIARAELATIERGGSPKEIADLRNQLSAAERARARAREQIEALQRLVGKQAAARTELKDAESSLADREAEVELWRKKLELGAAPEQRDGAMARIREAESALALATRQVSSSVVRAPAEGMIYSLDVRPGVYLTPGTRVARVGKVDPVKVVILVDEPELGGIRLGAPVTITADAYPEKSWQGRVDRLPSEVVSIETRRVGEVWCRVSNPGKELITNLTVSAQVESAVVENALTLPREAVVREGEQTYVWLIGPQGTAERRRVELGIRDGTRTQITSGVDETDQVLLPGPEPLEVGKRVIAAAQAG